MTQSPVGTVYLLKRAELAVRGCMELALAEADLTPSQYFILFLVKCGEATSSAELARAMGVLPQSMTELIAPLEQRGAILRRPDPTNNRILRIEVTAEGEKIFAKGTEIAIRIESELLEGFDERELARLNRAFTDLIAQAEAHSYHPNLRRLSKAQQRLTKAQAKDKSIRGAKKLPVKRRAASRR
jgi:DNA-binding MarR family transcriptional regulator